MGAINYLTFVGVLADIHAYKKNINKQGTNLQKTEDIWRGPMFSSGQKKCLIDDKDVMRNQLYLIISIFFKYSLLSLRDFSTTICHH